MKMNKKQYNNVIEYTLKHELPAQTDDSLSPDLKKHCSSGNTWST